MAVSKLLATLVAAMDEKAKIRVLHLSSERSWRGGEQQIAYLIQATRNMGVEALVAARTGSAFQEWCMEEGVEVHGMPFVNSMDARSALMLRSLARKKRIDLIHVHSGKAHGIAYLASVLGMRVPIIVHRRVDFPIGTSHWKLAKYRHRNVKRIICVSQAIADIVNATLAKPEMVKVVHDGIDFTRFEQGAEPQYARSLLGTAVDDDTLLVANVAALAPHKDYPSFLRTAAKVAATRSDVHFMAIGEGDDRPALESLHKGLGLEGKCSFLGFREDVPQLLQSIDIFLITSKTEGLGSSIIDAMYCGLPVVATRAGGIPEIVEEGVSGLLCAPGDLDCLATQLQRLLDDAALREKMGRAGKERSKQFSAEKMGRKVVELYRQSLAEQASQGLKSQKR